jgi:hypothetical protein
MVIACTPRTPVPLELLNSFLQSGSVNRILCFLLVIIGVWPAVADDGQQIASLVRETQKVVSDSGTLAVALWIPIQMFQDVIKTDTKVTADKQQDLLKTAQDYVLIALVDARKGQTGLSFTPSEDILKSAKLTGPDGQTVTALADANLNPAAQNLVGVVKPLFAGMMGRLGQNFQLLVFPGADSDGKKLADPMGEGRVTLAENEHSFSWRLPLASLFPEKICPKCGEHLPGNYKYCPYDGTKLSN